MSKVLVIPDIHLKTQMLDRAEIILKSKQADFAVQLGDLFDDWGATATEYIEMSDRIQKFINDFPDTKLCWGNHDFAYWRNISNLSGHQYWASPFVEQCLYDLMKKTELKICWQIGNVFFSHAGLAEDFTKYYCEKHNVKIKYTSEDFIAGKNFNADELVDTINSLDKDSLWSDDSPLWVRPQIHDIRMFKAIQVVGHTPIEKVIEKDSVISTDVFSTYRSGNPIGECRFIIIDSISGVWQYANE